MVKKVLIVFLIFAYMHCYLGCTTTRSYVVGGSELNESLNHGNEYPIQIITLDSTRYAFENIATGLKMIRLSPEVG